MSCRVSMSFCIHVVLFWWTFRNLLHSQSLATPTTNKGFGGNETDQLALQAFKAGTAHDPFRVMTSWNHSLHFCQWEGVRCGGRRHPERVRFLHLDSRGLVGFISPHIGNLSFLREINLQNNSFHGEIPQDLGRLFRLRVLVLRNNSLGGKIPTNLSHCSSLIVLGLSYNNLAGKLPVEFGIFPKLTNFGAFHNNLMGEIPPSFGNLSSLKFLSVTKNNLQGRIPDSLGRLSSLTFLGLATNKLSGMVPSSIYNLSSITTFVLAQNRLQGSLPPDLGFMFPNLQSFIIFENQFTGPIPISLNNSSELEVLEISTNTFIRKVPINFGGMRSLTVLIISENHLGSGEADDLSFIDTLTNCSSLIVLALDINRFGGALPNSVTNLSTQLEDLVLGYNQIYGIIPTGIGNLVNLDILDIGKNQLTGKIPSSIVKIKRLRVISLSGNKLSGEIPFFLGNLTLLSSLGLEGNNLEGEIPPSLGNCKNLIELYLSVNMLGGTIPKEVFGISSLSIALDLSQNKLVGSLPPEVGDLKSLVRLDVSRNKLFGEIPNNLGSCTELEKLHMEGNFFQGSIPLSLNSLRSIKELNLSHNNFSGLIPKFMQNFSLLQILDLSFNDLEGEVPTEGIFLNISLVSIIGNNKLCGGVSELHLPVCLIKKLNKQGSPLALKPVIAICSGVLLCFILILSLYLHRRKKRRMVQSSKSLITDRLLSISYEELLKATGGFSSANLIGVGSFGSVYKGILDNGETIVAVKVLNLQQQGASKSFMAECEALRNIRHRNLVKILTACSSTDFEGNDFKALVFEFMPNGSLEKWLHPGADDAQDGLMNLNLLQRLNIAIDVASALEYLHHHCQIPIIHCDLKPNNILLDNDMTAHVGDFGLSRFLSEATNAFSQNHSSSIGIRGSIGYVAPEYGVGVRVSSHGDLYSYGILLLEMFTGKRPIDEMFRNGSNLHSLAKMAVSDGVMDVIDPTLLSMEEAAAVMNNNESHRNMIKCVQDCLTSLVRIGIACSVESPRERMNMIDVVKQLHLIKDIYLGVGIHG